MDEQESMEYCKAFSSEAVQLLLTEGHGHLEIGIGMLHTACMSIAAWAGEDGERLFVVLVQMAKRNVTKWNVEKN